MSASQRRKGGAGEREAAGILSDALGLVVKRNIGQSRDGGDDITIPKKTGRFRVEVKRRKTMSVSKWIRQAKDACEPDDTPVVLMREDGGDWVAALPLDYFIEMMREQI